MHTEFPRFFLILDYAIAMFHEAIKNGSYQCYLQPNTMLPMIYIEDCLRALLEFLTAPNELLKRRVYNVTAMSFAPEDLAAEIKKYFPLFEIMYNPDTRQAIGKYFFTKSIKYVCIEFKTLLLILNINLKVTF